MIFIFDPGDFLFGIGSLACLLFLVTAFCLWLDRRRARQLQEPAISADDLVEYMEFKTLLDHYDRRVKFSTEETYNLFRIWLEHVPEMSTESDRQEEEEQA